MAKRILTAIEARELCSYDPETGFVSRTISISNSTKPGEVPSRNNGDGYSRITVMGQRHYVHRLVWLLHYGEWPSGQIDHIDGDRSNNRLWNLRDVDHTTNAQNIHVGTSASGLMGATYDKKRKKYCAQLSVGPRGKAKCMHLGRFDTAAEAHEVYLAAKRRHHAGFTG